MLESVQPTYSFPFVNVPHLMDLFFKYLLAFRDSSNTYKKASLGNEYSILKIVSELGFPIARECNDLHFVALGNCKNHFSMCINILNWIFRQYSLYTFKPPFKHLPDLPKKKNSSILACPLVTVNIKFDWLLVTFIVLSAEPLNRQFPDSEIEKHVTAFLCSLMSRTSIASCPLMSHAYVKPSDILHYKWAPQIHISSQSTTYQELIVFIVKLEATSMKHIKVANLDWTICMSTVKLSVVIHERCYCSIMVTTHFENLCVNTRYSLLLP